MHMLNFLDTFSMGVTFPTIIPRVIPQQRTGEKSTRNDICKIEFYLDEDHHESYSDYQINS